MLQPKDILQISELKEEFHQSAKIADRFLDWLGFFDFASVYKALDSVKAKGYPVRQLLSVLIIVPFIGKASVYSLIKSGFSGLSEPRKDSYYRMKNRDDIPWHKLLAGFVSHFMKIIEAKGAKVDGRCCLVIDDSLLGKSGKYMEGISRLWDHVTMSFQLGYRLLLLGYYDGKSFLPVNFSLHREKGKREDRPYGLRKSDLKGQYERKRDSKSYQARQLKIMDEDKISSGIRMIKSAVRFLKVDYLLMDSWFTCKKMLDCAKACRVQLIGMMKMGKAKYFYQGLEYNAAGLLNKLKSKARRCRFLSAHYVEVPVIFDGQEVKLFFSRFDSGGKWHLLLTTDRNLTYRKMMELYQIRWGIEVFFKEAKQYLNLGKSQSEDFSGQVANVTITMLQYILLTLKKRFGDYESKGAVFRQGGEEILALTLADRLWALLIELVRIIVQILELPVNDIEALLNKITLNNDFQEILEKLTWKGSTSMCET